MADEEPDFRKYVRSTRPAYSHVSCAKLAYAAGHYKLTDAVTNKKLSPAFQ